MKSYLPQFDWNSGDEINPWDWLWDDEDKNVIRVNNGISFSIRKK